MAGFLVIKGFSLVEILISLFVVSVAAVNITELQQRVGGQGRDNFIHGVVLKLSTEKIEEMLQLNLISALESLDGEKENIIEAQTKTKLTLTWAITSPDSIYNAGVDVREVALQITWDNASGEKQTFNRREQVNLMQLLEMDTKAAEVATIIEPIVDTKEVIYFESAMSYKTGALVIYNSELFVATKDHSAGGDSPKNIINPELVADGWQSYGLINNLNLADNTELTALFAD